MLRPAPLASYYFPFLSFPLLSPCIGLSLDINKREGPNIPLLLSLVGNEKGCSHIYKRIISKNGDILSKCAGKWSESLLEEISAVKLSQSFKKKDKDIDCTYFRYLQFRLLHRRIFTNELLYCMKIVDSPECPLCNNIPETIEHAFLECQKIHTLWRQIEIWSGMVLRDNIKISDSEKKYLVLPTITH